MKQKSGNRVTRRAVLSGIGMSAAGQLLGPRLFAASHDSGGAESLASDGDLKLDEAAVTLPMSLRSPGGSVVVDLEIIQGRLAYAVHLKGKEVIRLSLLGLKLDGAARLDSHFVVKRAGATQVRGSWRPVYGERDVFPDDYNAVVLELQETISPGRRLGLEFRAYDEGVSFRYRVPEQEEMQSFVIGDEVTEFRLPEQTYGWATPTAQGLYQRTLIEELTGASERPFLLQLANGVWAAIAEAGVEDYPSMFVAPLHAERHSLCGKLMGAAVCCAPCASPWRVLLVGDRPGDLLEHNYLLQNLSPASRLKETEWIRPGKVMREITLSTRGGRETIDFAARQKIQYVEYDAGWYGDQDDEGADATRVDVTLQAAKAEPSYRGLDLQEVIDYGRSKGVGVILYINRRAMERQLDAILPLYAKWGVAGIKYGFVNVHSQPWTRLLYDAVRKAGEYRMLLDVHDEFRPTGLSRTYPHLLTQEGIRGNEEFPNAAHSTTLPFTRMLAGAADYTYCWLDPRLKNTWGHQMALAVVLYSPLQFIYWYDRPTAFGEDTVGMEWFRDLPTVWNDTKVLEGMPGEFVALARRSGNDWFLGAVTNDNARTTRLPLEMLASGHTYEATIFADGDGPHDVRRTTRTFRRGETLELSLQAKGGAAVRLKEV